MNRDKKIILAISCLILASYAFIVTRDFGPIPRAQSATEPVRSELVEASFVSDPSALDRASSRVLAVRDHDHWVALGDILVDKEQVVHAAGKSATVTIDQVRTWPQAEVPVVVEVHSRVHRLQKAMRIIEEYTPVRFVPADGRGDFVAIRNVEFNACWSHLGRQGGRQEVLLHASCTTGGIMHALLHTLGLTHTHNRADRNEHIAIHWRNIFTAKRHLFQKMPAEISNFSELPFDPLSLTMYPTHAHSKNNLPTVTFRDGSLYQHNASYLSRGDIAALRGLYDASAL